MYRDTSELFQYTKLTNLADIEGLSGGYIPVLQNYILKKDGTVVWYPDDEAYIPDPYADFTPNLRDVVAIDAGYFYHVALRRDGTVLAWGKNTECVNVPLGLKDVTKVVAGCHHVLALKSDGTVVVWGNDFGYDTLQIPNGITNVVDIAASKDNYSAMMENIELYDNYVNDSERPIAGHNMVVTADGKVYAWGNNSYGQCDIPAGLPPVKSVACASQYSMVLTNDNRIFCWGQLNMII
jgi:alpha-tubulin suppressor-like RCC1 family protein